MHVLVQANRGPDPRTALNCACRCLESRSLETITCETRPGVVDEDDGPEGSGCIYKHDAILEAIYSLQQTRGLGFNLSCLVGLHQQQPIMAPSFIVSAESF